MNLRTFLSVALLAAITNGSGARAEDGVQDLQIGDPAPDFTLPVLHGERVVTLSNEYRQKPVVLVFGRYT